MITGASGGLASSVASTLSDKGWQLALVTRDLNKLSQYPEASTCCPSPVISRQ